MSLPLNFDAALTALCSPRPLPVYDSAGGWFDGAFVESAPVRRARPIQAVCLAMSPAELELYPQGDLSGGGISLLTKAELYWRDSGLVVAAETNAGETADAAGITDATGTADAITTDAKAWATDTDTPGPDASDVPPLSGLELRQSYVDWQGRRYRVVGSGLIQPNANFHIYHCLRFLF